MTLGKYCRCFKKPGGGKKKAFPFAFIFLGTPTQGPGCSNLRKAEVPGSHSSFRVKWTRWILWKNHRCPHLCRRAVLDVQQRWLCIILCFLPCLCRDARGDEPQWCKANPSNRRQSSLRHNGSRMYSGNRVNDISSDGCGDVAPWALVTELSSLVSMSYSSLIYPLLTWLG